MVVGESLSSRLPANRWAVISKRLLKKPQICSINIFSIKEDKWERQLFQKY
jgi:hypothetical protein